MEGLLKDSDMCTCLHYNLSLIYHYHYNLLLPWQSSDDVDPSGAKVFSRHRVQVTTPGWPSWMVRLEALCANQSVSFCSRNTFWRDIDNFNVWRIYYNGKNIYKKLKCEADLIWNCQKNILMKNELEFHHPLTHQCHIYYKRNPGAPQAYIPGV